MWSRIIAHALLLHLLVFIWAAVLGWDNALFVLTWQVVLALTVLIIAFEYLGLRHHEREAGLHNDEIRAVVLEHAKGERGGDLHDLRGVIKQRLLVSDREIDRALIALASEGRIGVTKGGRYELLS